MKAKFRISNRIVGFMLVLVMVVGLIPHMTLTALAANDKYTATYTQESSGHTYTFELTRLDRKDKNGKIFYYHGNVKSVYINQATPIDDFIRIEFGIKFEYMANDRIIYTYYDVTPGECDKEINLTFAEPCYGGDGKSPTVPSSTFTATFQVKRSAYDHQADVTCLNSAVCTVCGTSYTKQHAPAATWITENGEHYRICNNGCGIKLDLGTCSYSPATCLAASVCSTCNYTYAEQLSHNYTYTKTAENVLTETCNNGCTHSATAKLIATDATYTGAAITGTASVTYSDGWIGERVDANTITYSDNRNVGTAAAKIMIEGKELTTTFKINAADISNATVTLNPTSGTYDGTEQKPSVSVVWNNMTLLENTDYTVSYVDNVNASGATVHATAYIDGINNFTGRKEAVFEISNAQLTEVEVKQQGTLTYNGQAQTPVVTAKATAVNNQTVNFTYSSSENGTYGSMPVFTDAGTYTVYYKASAPNHNEITGSFTVTVDKADQAAPIGIGKTDETISQKGDGKITGVTANMEYRKDGENTYTAITGSTIENLAAGKYFVRVKGDSNRNPSPETEVNVAAGRKLTVKVPQNQVGYTMTTTTPEVDYFGSIRVEFKLLDGYSMNYDFQIYNKTEPVGFALINDTYVYELNFVVDDFDFTVKGVADITPPAAEIKVKENSWTSFLNNLTFGLFFKETQDVTITATDKGSGVKNIQYYLAGRELELDEVRAITDWVDYNGTFKINPDNNYVVYAKVADNDGNVAYINSEGIVLDATAPVIEGIENGKTYYTTQKVTVTEKNVDTITLDGSPTTENITLDGNKEATYTITVTDKAGNTTTVTVTMKPIKALAEATEDLGYDNVTSADAPALKELVEKLDELLADENVSDGERETLEQHKHIAESLLQTIDNAADATDTENTEKVKNVTAENVTPGDKTDLEKAKDDLEKALENNSGNYTEDEKKAIEDEIKRIDDALEVIGNVETVEGLIEKLPENIKKSDESAIKAADEAYNALTDYEKSLVVRMRKRLLRMQKRLLQS